MASLHQPHDHLFRLVFADPEETAAFLRARLPDSLRGSFLWSSLRRAAGSFVDQELRGSVSDLLFEVRGSFSKSSSDMGRLQSGSPFSRKG